MATFKSYQTQQGKKWQFQAYLGLNPVTGKPVKTTRRGFTSKKEAQLALSRLQVDFEKNGLNKTDHMTFEKLYCLWFKQHSKNIQPTTQQRIRIYFEKHILQEFGSLEIQKITPLFCQEKLDYWSEKMKSYSKLKVYINKVFNYGILIGVLADNPMARTITPKPKQSTRSDIDTYYTKDELKEFFRCLLRLKDRRAYAFFRVLAFAGLRKGEAMALTYNDIDFENNLIHVNKTLVEFQNGTTAIQEPKTESSKRSIQVDNQTISILREWKNHIIQEKLSLGIRENNIKDNVVFSNSIFTNENSYLYHGYANAVLKKVYKHFPELKQIKVHDFRRTNASLLFESGASIKDVSQRLGHKSSKITTDIYIKVTQTKQNETANKFAEYMAF